MRSHKALHHGTMTDGILQRNLGTAWLGSDTGVKLGRETNSGALGRLAGVGALHTDSRAVLGGDVGGQGRVVGSTSQQLRLRDTMLADLRAQNKALAGASTPWLHLLC